MVSKEVFEQHYKPNRYATLMRQITLDAIGQTTVVATPAAEAAIPEAPKSNDTSLSTPVAAASEPNVSTGKPGILVVVTNTGAAAAVSAAVAERVTSMRSM